MTFGVFTAELFRCSDSHLSGPMLFLESDVMHIKIEYAQHVLLNFPAICGSARFDSTYFSIFTVAALIHL